MSRAAKPVAMCCVQIGYQKFLMPADKGMKLVELLQHAVQCDLDFGDGGKTYVVREQPNVEFSLVKPEQIRAPEGALDAAPVPVRALRQPRLLK